MKQAVTVQCSASGMHVGSKVASCLILVEQVKVAYKASACRN